jgi:hypothetical protein
MCPGVDSASKNEYQETAGGKGGRCVRLTTFHLHVPNVEKIRSLNLPDPLGQLRPVDGKLYLYNILRGKYCLCKFATLQIIISCGVCTFVFDVVNI